MCIILQSNVVAYIDTSETPSWFNTLHGTHVSGDNDDLQHIDGDAVHWKGNYYYLGNWLLGWAWIVQPVLHFNYPGYTYENVYLVIKFKYSGCNDLRIIVFYTSGAVDEFYEPSTGGVFKTKSYNLEDYSKVSRIHVYSYIHYLSGGQQHVYIDYAEVGYYNM